MTAAPHPGLIFNRFWFEPRKISLEKAAHMLDISVDTLDKFLKGEVKITPDLAESLDRVSSLSKESWIEYQKTYDKTNG
jgi:addiction module HigA family antidote